MENICTIKLFGRTHRHVSQSFMDIIAGDRYEASPR